MNKTGRKERQREERKELILNAALNSLAKYGYHGTSMDIIASEADLGKSTIYYYFKTKDEILTAILERGFLIFFGFLEEEWSRLDDPLKKLQKVSDAAVKFFSGNPDYFKLYNYINAHPQLRKKSFGKLNSTIKKKIGKFEELFNEAKKQKLIRNIPSSDLVELFGYLIMGIGVFAWSTNTKAKLKKKAKLINQIFFEGISK